MKSLRAAYCLVNLEAAITFLETVDLASLRSDEPLSGPSKSESRPTTPHTEPRPQWISHTSKTPPASPASASASAMSDQQASPHLLESPSITKPTLPTNPSHQRTLSNLFQPPASALGAASDVVRTTADQGFKTIGNTLDNSFKRKHHLVVIFRLWHLCSDQDTYGEQESTRCFFNMSSDNSAAKEKR